ncbi:hypothetical protein Rrhod_2817 [Rhodococcus rhodnii LMG 5362]|uniref:Uncharacterized protein n=1 Tax=Rhodococcus rhodnii LMG 5362 TaxID=1273125 RepID=R7WKU8_9NOCA|nr:hypothetical protein Rrhod_2817 [Rhodococcus rhodnii LMG 5362]
MCPGRIAHDREVHRSFGTSSPQRHEWTVAATR